MMPNLKVRKHHRVVSPEWSKRMDDRERRIEEREARKDRVFEQFSSTLTALAESLKSKQPEALMGLDPVMTMPASYKCDIQIDMKPAANVQQLGLHAIMDLISSLCLQHPDALYIHIGLTKCADRNTGV